MGGGDGGGAAAAAHARRAALLAPGHPDYKAKYDGDLRARDAAYHQARSGPGSSVPSPTPARFHPGEQARARSFRRASCRTGRGLHRVHQRFDAEALYAPLRPRPERGRGAALLDQDAGIALILAPWWSETPRGPGSPGRPARAIRLRVVSVLPVCPAGGSFLASNHQDGATTCALHRFREHRDRRARRALPQFDINLG